MFHDKILPQSVDAVAFSPFIMEMLLEKVGSKPGRDGLCARLFFSCLEKIGSFKGK